MPTTVTDMSGRGRRLLPAAVFLCVAGAHIWMIWMAPSALSFSVRHIHTDNAVILLMGKHMLEKGEFPIFYYGQDWFGSLSAVVHAGVFLVLGGIPPWSIHVAPLLFFLGFCLVLYRLTHDTLGPAVALWALAWNIATPVHLAEYAVMPHGGYVESLMLGTLLLWLAVRLVMARGTRRQDGYYALLGLVGGVAWWTSPLVVYQILASGIYVVMRERLTAVLKGALLSLPAFFLGAAPFFYFYAVDPYSSVLGLGGGYALANVPTGLSLARHRASAAVPGLDALPVEAPLHVRPRRRRLWRLHGGPSVASPPIVPRSVPPEERRHLPDLLPRRHAPLHREHPHPTGLSTVRAPAVRVLPRGRGVLPGACLSPVAAGHVVGLRGGVPAARMDDRRMGRARRAACRGRHARLPEP